MPATKEQLERFHRFAAEKLGNGGASLSLEELLREWRAAEERSEIDTAIRKGLADVAAGNYRPLDAFMTEFRAKHGLGDK